MYAQAEINFKHPCKYIFLGKSGSGKTTLLVYIICNYFNNQVDRVIVVCPTFRFQETFDPIRSLVREDDIYDDFDKNPFPEIVERLLEEKRIAKQSGSPQVRSLLIIDDMSGSNAIHNNRKGPFAKIATQIKNFNLSVFALIQAEKTIDPNYRENLSGMVIYPTQCIQDLVKWIYKEQNPNGIEKDDIEAMVWTAFLNNKKDSFEEEFGKNFMFIVSDPRTYTRYFINFTHEMRTKYKRRRMYPINP